VSTRSSRLFALCAVLFLACEELPGAAGGRCNSKGVCLPGLVCSAGTCVLSDAATFDGDAGDVGTDGGDARVDGGGLTWEQFFDRLDLEEDLGALTWSTSRNDLVVSRIYASRLSSITPDGGLFDLNLRTNTTEVPLGVGGLASSGSAQNETIWMTSTGPNAARLIRTGTSAHVVVLPSAASGCDYGCAAAVTTSTSGVYFPYSRAIARADEQGQDRGQLSCESQYLIGVDVFDGKLYAADWGGYRIVTVNEADFSDAPPIGSAFEIEGSCSQLLNFLALDLRPVDLAIDETGMMYVVTVDTSAEESTMLHHFALHAIDLDTPWMLRTIALPSLHKSRASGVRLAIGGGNGESLYVLLQSMLLRADLTALRGE
jgi:hypothetical protein